MQTVSIISYSFLQSVKLIYLSILFCEQRWIAGLAQKHCGLPARKDSLWWWLL